MKGIIPGLSLSTDIIAGFCGETDSEHDETITLMQEVKWDFAYMYKYSERPKTLAERRFKDDVSEEIKSKRLTEIIDLQQSNSLKNNQARIGKTYKVLVESTSKRSNEHMSGRTDQNIKTVFQKKNAKKGEYVLVKITDCTTATLLGDIVEIL